MAAFKKVLRLIAIVLAIVAVVLATICLVQYFADTTYFFGASDSLLASLPGVGTIFGSLSIGGALGLAAIALAAAYVCSPDDAKKVVKRYTDSLAHAVVGTGGAIIGSVGKATFGSAGSFLFVAVAIFVGYKLINRKDGADFDRYQPSYTSPVREPSGQYSSGNHPQEIYAGADHLFPAVEGS